MDVRRNTRLNGRNMKNDDERYNELQTKIRQKISLVKENWFKS